MSNPVKRKTKEIVVSLDSSAELDIVDLRNIIFAKYISLQKKIPYQVYLIQRNVSNLLNEYFGRLDCEIVYLTPQGR